jgi:hypothetical protein
MMMMMMMILMSMMVMSMMTTLIETCLGRGHCHIVHMMMMMALRIWGILGVATGAHMMRVVVVIAVLISPVGGMSSSCRRCCAAGSAGVGAALPQFVADAQLRA